jgi:hypothetical protein
MKRRLFVVPFVAASLLAVLPVSSTLAQPRDTGSLTEPSSEPPAAPTDQTNSIPPPFPIKSIPECKPEQTAKDGCVPECKPGQTTVNDDCVAGPFPLNMRDFAGKKYKPDYTKPLGTPWHQYFGHSALEEYYMKHPELLKNGPNASSETIPYDVRRRLYGPDPATAPPQPDSSPSSLKDPAPFDGDASSQFPPDVAAALSDYDPAIPNSKDDIVQFMNDALTVWNKSGTQLKQTSLTDFWCTGTTLCTVPAGDSFKLTDTQVAYAYWNGRWTLSTLLLLTSNGQTVPGGALLVAASSG